MFVNRKIALTACALTGVVLLTASSCDNATPAATQQEQQSAQTGLAAMLKSQPVPKYDWSQIRQTLIDAETAQADTTQTTSFFFVNGVPNPIFVCPSIGLPVAATSQITNPQQLIDNNGSQNYYGTGVVNQIDPNGIYSGDTSATYVLCAGATGKVFLNHAEEIVHSVTGPATWDAATKRIVLTGDPSFKVKVGK